MTKKPHSSAAGAGVALLLAAALLVAPHARADGTEKTCERYWSKQGPVREEEIQIYVNESIPAEAEPIPGFVLKSFVRADGRKVVPRTLAESDCHLKRAIPPKLERAFILGARDASAGGSTNDDDMDDVEKEEQELQRLAGSINAQIDAALGSRGDLAGFGVTSLQIFLDSEFGFSRWDKSKRPVLQRRIERSGIWNVNLQMFSVVLSYVASLGETQYAPANFRNYLEADPGD